jgi:hypothetical protein
MQKDCRICLQERLAGAINNRACKALLQKITHLQG